MCRVYLPPERDEPPNEMSARDATRNISQPFCFPPNSTGARNAPSNVDFTKHLQYRKHRRIDSLEISAKPPRKARHAAIHAARGWRGVVVTEAPHDNGRTSFALSEVRRRDRVAWARCLAPRRLSASVHRKAGRRMRSVMIANCLVKSRG